MPTPYADPSTLIQFVRFAKAAGIDIDNIVDHELRDILKLAEVAALVPAHGIVDLLQVCATILNRPCIGAEFTMWANLRGYGPLSLMWDQCPNYAEAIRINHRYVHLETASLGTELIEDGEAIILQHLLLLPARYGGSQFLLGTLTLELRVARLILGEKWRPLQLELQQPRSWQSRYLEQVFGCPIEYGADRNALHVRREDLYKPSAFGNAHLLAYLERQLERTERSHRLPFLLRVERAISTNLPGGDIRLPKIAALFSMSERTFLRRLAAEGTKFSDLTTNARKNVTREYLLRQARPQLTELAHLLGYSDSTAASRFLRKHMKRGIYR